MKQAQTSCNLPSSLNKPTSVERTSGRHDELMRDWSAAASSGAQPRPGVGPCQRQSWPGSAAQRATPEPLESGHWRPVTWPGLVGELTLPVLAGVHGRVMATV